MNTETMKQATSIAELKSAYRKLAFENHPDRGGSEEAMKEVNRVFTVCFDRLKGHVVTKADNEDFGAAKTAREYTDFVYNEYRRWEGSRYDMNLSLSDICRRIKEYAAKRFPTCKFSVHKDGYRAIDVVLVSGDFSAYATEKDKESGYRSFNHHHTEINTEYSERCREVLRLVSEYAQSYNYDNSDIMTDYFDVNFYLNVTVGKWNKAYVDTSVVIKGEKIAKTETEKLVQKAVGAGNWVYMTTRARTGGYYVCERGDDPYPRYYSQYTVVKAKIAKLREIGLDAEWRSSGIMINNWEEFEKRIGKERKEMESAKKEAAANKETSEKETSEVSSATVEYGDVRIVDYSDRAIAVVGNTKPIKDILKSAGGSFNSRLSCGCGWVFSKKRRSEVERLVGDAQSA